MCVCGVCVVYIYLNKTKKNARCTKKQENVIHIQKKNQSIEKDPAMSHDETSKKMTLKQQLEIYTSI